MNLFPSIPLNVSNPWENALVDQKNSFLWLVLLQNYLKVLIFQFLMQKWSQQYDLICAQNSLLYKTHIEPKRTKGCYMSSNRYFWCGSEFLCFDSPQFPTGMSYLKKSDFLTKIFQFFHLYYPSLSQKCLFSTF